MTLESVLPYATGPASAVMVCLLVGAMLWKTFHATILPLVSSTIDRHLQQIDDMSSRHGAEHAAMLSQLQACATRMEQLDERLRAVL
jgi:hypothetical protein